MFSLSHQLIEAVAQEACIRHRHVLAGAAVCAVQLWRRDGFSRVNDRRKFGVVITQGGPGSENSGGGIAQAFADNVPVLYLTAGPALSRYAIRPEFSPVRAYQGISKRGEVIVQPNQVNDVMRRAFHALRNGPPGPVIVEIPADIGGQEVPEGTPRYKPPSRSLQCPSTNDVKDAVRLLLNAKKPMIWSGMGVLFADATEELKELAELSQIPVYCTMPGKSSFDERHPLSLGSGSGATTLPALALATGVRCPFRRRFKYDEDILRAADSRR